MDLNKIDFTKFEDIILDLGCGSARQAYRQAKQNPQHLYIGIDANPNAFDDVQKMAKMKVKRGGVRNLVLMHANALDLPEELIETVDEIQIHFPWGSLLEMFVKKDETFLNNLKKITKSGSRVMIYFTYDDKFEQNFMSEYSLPALDLEFVKKQIVEQYQQAGIEFEDYKTISFAEKKKLDSPWGKKILSQRNRDVYLLRGIINK